MKQQVIMFSGSGHDVVLEYEPETADMAEVNRVVDRVVKAVGGKKFSLATAEAVDVITPETRDVTIVRPIAGG